MGKNKICSFFGHRKIAATETLKQQVRAVIENLIIKHHVSIFLFGSHSEFDTLCHLIVTELKTQYQNIERIAYTCKSESCTLENERQKWESIYARYQNSEVRLIEVEKEFEHKTKYTAGKASYVERNQAMIDDSDYCIFYYDVNYRPGMKKLLNRSLAYYQPPSGTKLAYDYARQKSKIVLNLYRND